MHTRKKNSEQKNCCEPQYPIATIAYYGPDSSKASKVSVGFFLHSEADAELIGHWHSEEGDVRYDETIQQEIFATLIERGVKSRVTVDRIIGCPHEEGKDYPEGTKCPSCTYWIGRERWSGELEN